MNATTFSCVISKSCNLFYSPSVYLIEMAEICTGGLKQRSEAEKAGKQCALGEKHKELGNWASNLHCIS